MGSALAEPEGTMTVITEMTQLLEDYRHVWDADAPRDLVDRVFAPDVVDHNPQPSQGDGRDGVRQVIDLYHSVFPDLRVTTEDTIVADDRAVLRWSAEGTHEGGQLGVPATHRTVRLTGIDIVRVHDARIVVERWGETNGLEMMKQIS
jgi:predicted ester cyclase